MADSQRSIADTCSPVFVFLATFRRNSASSTMSVADLHEKLAQVIHRVEEAFEKDERISKIWSRVKYPLVATIDQVIIASQWKLRMSWPANLLEMKTYQTKVGGHQFWRIVDEVFREQGKQASEFAELLFRCVAFGFQGELLGRTRDIELKKQQLFEKARLPIDSGAQLCPEAYGKNVVKPMAKHSTVALTRLLLVCAGLLFFVWLTANELTRGYKTRVTLGAQRLAKSFEHYTGASNGESEGVGGTGTTGTSDGK